jgi:hypothetical protein
MTHLTQLTHSEKAILLEALENQEKKETSFRPGSYTIRNVSSPSKTLDIQNLKKKIEKMEPICQKL